MSDKCGSSKHTGSIKGVPKGGISMKDVGKFKELDKSKYEIKKKPKKSGRSPFDIGLTTLKNMV